VNEHGAATDSRALVERASRGDLPAVEELLARHTPGLRAYVRLRCGAVLRAKESASDIVQSACRDVLQNIGHFRYGGEAGFKAWLYEAAARKLLDRAEYWAAGKRDPAREAAMQGARSESGDVLLADVYRTMGTPSEAAIGREALDRIERGFERLSEEEREVVVLARLIGLSHAEIGARLGCSEGAARLRLFRALATLADVMGEGGPARRTQADE
jgi:RNA polymerase sigma-70 factor, ECF subfamily